MFGKELSKPLERRAPDNACMSICFQLQVQCLRILVTDILLPGIGWHVILEIFPPVISPPHTSHLAKAFANCTHL